MRRSEESGEIIFDFGFTDNLEKSQQKKTRQDSIKLAKMTTKRTLLG